MSIISAVVIILVAAVSALAIVIITIGIQLRKKDVQVSGAV